MNIEIIHGDITAAATEAIVNSANSQGTMEAGVAAAIKEAGGAEIEVAAQEQSPCPVGNAYITAAGALPFQGIIHAPTMEHPDEPIPLKQVEQATVAALRCADEAGYRSVAFPLLGAGTGDVDPMDAARIMVETIQMYMVDNELADATVYAFTTEELQALEQATA